MATRVRQFFFTALNVDSSPIKSAAVIAQLVLTPPVFYPEGGFSDGVNTDPFVVGTTDNTGYVEFDLFAPQDLDANTGYYTVTINNIVFTTDNFAWTTGRHDFSAVVVTPGTGPTTVDMLAQWWEVNSVGWTSAFLNISLEVDGIIDATDDPVSATDQKTFKADGSGLITAPLIPTSAFRGTIKPKWKAILPSGKTYLFTAPDGGGNIFAGATVASGTSIVGPAGAPAATDWVTVTTNVTATSTNNSILADTTSGNIIVTLPSAATAQTPFSISKKDGSSNSVTITPSGGALINGNATFPIISQGTVIVLLSDGTNWFTWADGGAATDATETLVGGVLIDHNPVSGHPVAVTVPSVGAAEGVARLDITAHVPLVELPLLDPAQVGATFQAIMSDNTRPFFGRITGIPTFMDPTTADNQLLYRKVTTVTTCVIGIIGDDLSLDTYNVPANMITKLNAAGGVTYTKNNQAVAGTKSGDWLHTGSHYSTATTAFAGAGVRLVIIALGTNDSRVSVATSASTFGSNIRDIAEHLVADGFIPILMQPPAVDPPADSGDFNTTSNNLLFAYETEINRAVNGFNIFQGDTLAFQHFLYYTGEFTDGWHMNTTGQGNWAELWYGAVRRYTPQVTRITTLHPLTLGTNLSITSGVLNAAGGSSSFVWVPKTANYTITTSDSGILGDSTSGNITITLPTAVGATQSYSIKKKDSSVHTVTIATTSGQTIDGASTYVATVQNESITVGSDNANWFIQ